MTTTTIVIKFVLYHCTDIGYVNILHLIQFCEVKFYKFVINDYAIVNKIKYFIVNNIEVEQLVK